MKGHLLIHFFLYYALILQGISFASESGAHEKEVAILLNQHIGIKSGIGTFDLINKHGEKLSKQTALFLTNPKNKRAVNSVIGKELQKHQTILANYLSVKEQFAKCLSDKAKSSNKKLSNRILQAFLETNCTMPILKNNALDELNHQVIKIADFQLKNQLQNDLAQQILENTARSLLGYQYKFEPEFMKDGTMTPNELDSIIHNVCFKKNFQFKKGPGPFDLCNALGSDFKKRLEQELISFAKSLKNKEKRFNIESATSSLNASIDRMNLKLSEIKVDEEKKTFSSSPQLTKQETKKQFEQYANLYVEEASRDSGPLLLTSTIKDIAGPMRSYDEGDTKMDQRSLHYKFIKHKHITYDDLKASLAEAREKIQRQADSVIKTSFYINQKKIKTINDLVKINPYAAGAVLARKPEYTSLICESINQIANEDESNKNFESAFITGGAILGGALILSGFGSMAGGYILTGSLTAGLAEGTVAGSIASYTTLAGAAYETTSFGYYGKKSFESYNEMNDIESSFLTKNTNTRSLVEAREAFLSFKEARLSSFTSFLSSGFSALPLRKIFNRLEESISSFSFEELRNASEILYLATEASAVKKLNQIISSMGALAEKKMVNFFLLLTKSNQRLLVHFLDCLKNSAIPSERIEEIIENAILSPTSQFEVSLANDLVNLTREYSKEKALEKSKEKALEYSNDEI